MLSITLTLIGVGAAAQSSPRFIDRANTLSAPHEYAGGWGYFVGGGVAIFDCNDDSLPDLFIAGGENPSRLLINASGSDLKFENASMPMIQAVTGAYPIDVNNDGAIDLMVLRNGPNKLFLGLGDCQFSEASEQLNLPTDDRWTTAFSATWESGQTYPTLAIGNYVDATDPNGPFGTCDTNWLLRSDGHRYGAPVALDPGYCPLSMLFSDWQRSGTPMLRISNDRQYYLHDGSEQMWTLDPLRALDAADGWPVQKIWGMGIASRDITGNGMPDVMLTSMGDQVLMFNDGQQFAPVDYAVGTYAQRPFTGDDGRPSTGWHAEFGDINNDGRADLFIAKGNVDQMPGLAMLDPNNLLLQDQDGTFTETAGVAGIGTTHRARGAGLADLNGDGLLDIVVVNRRAPLEIWQNISTETGNWLRIDPRQTDSNIFAIGAIVELRTADGVQAIERTIGGGHASGSLVPLHFGIGTHETAEVRIIWPNGAVGEWETVHAGISHIKLRP
ncbi:CRTAC1 family protein [Yoonia sp. I 8.24]|uniref:CRTAC1 family protein n=1 Tax=Yoonia sp. I 8.24 TaxID=1537229 RepID=UPI001EDCC776|nr:CRTAC1 family protein [Yoonia sp. I 8.24]